MARGLSRAALAGAVLAAAGGCAAADEPWRDLSLAFEPESCTIRLMSGGEEIDAATPAPAPCRLVPPRADAAALPVVPRPAGFAVFVVGEVRAEAGGRACGRVLTVVEVTPAGLRQGATLDGVMAVCEGDAPEETERSILTGSLDR